MMEITIIDRRPGLPVHPSRKFDLRSMDKIKYIVLHQQNGGGPLENVARYHIGPNHMSKRGCPGFCYHYHIAFDGTISQANDLNKAVWSSGKVKSYRYPSPNEMTLWSNMNTMSVSIMLQGDFDAVEHKGHNGDPTDAQFRAITRLRCYLLKELQLPPGRFIGHCHVNKRACPGFTAQAWIEELWTKPANLFIPDAKEIDLTAFMESLHNPFWTKP